MELARRFSRKARAFVVIALAIAFFLAVAVEHTDAHKPVTSKYDYNRDVFPLLREHCGRCHVKGGPGPMSLMTYTDTVPWAVSIRDELSAGRMPPSTTGCLKRAASRVLAPCRMRVTFITSTRCALRRARHGGERRHHQRLASRPDCRY